MLIKRRTIRTQRVTRWLMLGRTTQMLLKTQKTLITKQVMTKIMKKIVQRRIPKIQMKTTHNTSLMIQHLRETMQQKHKMRMNPEW